MKAVHLTFTLYRLGVQMLPAPPLPNASYSYFYLACPGRSPVQTVPLLGEALEGTHGVGARAEDEDQRGGGRHVTVQRAQVHRRVLHERLAQAHNHKLGHGKHHLEDKGGRRSVFKSSAPVVIIIIHITMIIIIILLLIIVILLSIVVIVIIIIIIIIIIITIIIITSPSSSSASSSSSLSLS